MEARERLNTVITKTKLIHSSVFSNETGNDVYIKPENLQRTGSFKLRGAYNKIAKLTEEEKKEREKYRKMYIEKFKESVRGHLDSIKVVRVDDDGNPIDDDGNVIEPEA